MQKDGIFNVELVLYNQLNRLKIVLYKVTTKLQRVDTARTVYISN